MHISSLSLVSPYFAKVSCLSMLMRSTGEGVEGRSVLNALPPCHVRPASICVVSRSIYSDVSVKALVIARSHNLAGAGGLDYLSGPSLVAEVCSMQPNQHPPECSPGIRHIASASSTSLRESNPDRVRP